LGDDAPTTGAAGPDAESDHATPDWRSLGVGDPCTPSDEAQPWFSGYAVTEVNIESRRPDTEFDASGGGAAQCVTGMCLVYHYQGRTSCPQGQAAAAGGCMTTEGAGGVQPVMTTVKPACRNRSAHDAVYCSRPCGGETQAAQCGPGFTCKAILEFIPVLGDLGVAYCVRDDPTFDPDDFQCQP